MRREELHTLLLQLAEYVTHLLLDHRGRSIKLQAFSPGSRRLSAIGVISGYDAYQILPNELRVRVDRDRSAHDVQIHGWSKVLDVEKVVLQLVAGFVHVGRIAVVDLCPA
jgi:hypothetical protein